MLKDICLLFSHISPWYIVIADTHTHTHKTSIIYVAELSSDDILAKYRKQPAAPDHTNQVKEKVELRDEIDSDSSPAYDPNNLEHCKAFLDAKKKLRMVLSTADFQVCILLCDILFVINSIIFINFDKSYVYGFAFQYSRLFRQ